MTEFVWLHYSLPRTSWYELDSEERARRAREFERQRERAEQEGAVRAGRFHVRGQSDYSHVEIWWFPSAEHAFEHWSRLVSVGYTRCFEFANHLGKADAATEDNGRNS